jgi:hypothetical protein
MDGKRSAIGTVSSYNNQSVDTRILYSFGGFRLSFGSFEFHASSGSQNCPSIIDNAAYRMSVHWAEQTVQKAFVSFFNSNYLHAFGNACPHNRPNGCIHAGSIPATCQHTYFVHDVLAKK